MIATETTPRLPSSIVPPGEGPSALFRKTILRVGTYKAETGDVVVTPQRLKHWESEFARMLRNRQVTPVFFDHVDDIRPRTIEEAKTSAGMVGFLRAFNAKADYAEIVIELRDARAIQRAASNLLQVSPTILPLWTDGAGNTYTDSIITMDLVSRPRDASQGPFTRLSLISDSLRNRRPQAPKVSMRSKRMAATNNSTDIQEPQLTDEQIAVLRWLWDAKKQNTAVSVADLIEARWPDQAAQIIPDETSDVVSTTELEEATQMALSPRSITREQARRYVDRQAGRLSDIRPSVRRMASNGGDTKLTEPQIKVLRRVLEAMNTMGEAIGLGAVLRVLWPHQLAAINGNAPMDDGIQAIAPEFAAMALRQGKLAHDTRAVAAALNRRSQQPATSVSDAKSFVDAQAQRMPGTFRS